MLGLEVELLVEPRIKKGGSSTFIQPAEIGEEIYTRKPQEPAGGIIIDRAQEFYPSGHYTGSIYPCCAYP